MTGRAASRMWREMAGTCLLQLCLLLLLLCPPASTLEERCRLPDAWSGLWYWKESVLNITTNTIGDKGRCVRMNGIRYLMERQLNGRGCYYCIVLFTRHRNIIEFKESRHCDGRRSLNQHCANIGGDSPLHTMVRVAGRPVACPFRGAFTFDYRRSDKVCDSPMSRVAGCSDPWRLVLHHQACPDVWGTEHLSEQLTCLATWRNHNEQFLFGRLDSVKTKTDADRYRCFKSRRFESSAGSGYHVVQSGDSTCQGLLSVHDGHKVMNFYHERVGRGGQCSLPSWFTRHHEWESVDGARRFHVLHKNHSVRITDLLPASDRSSEASGGNQSTKLLCVKHVQQTADTATLVVHRSRDCVSGYQCAVFYRRLGHVVELRLGEMTHSPDAACRKPDDVHRREIHTLVAAAAAARDHEGRYCPFQERRPGSDRRLRAALSCADGGGGGGGAAASTVELACGSARHLELHTETAGRRHTQRRRCDASWREDGVQYVVTSAADGGEQRARSCLVWGWRDGGGVCFSAVQPNCSRNFTAELRRRPSVAFNVSVQQQCQAEAVQIRASAGPPPPPSQLLLLQPLLLLLASCAPLR